MANRRFPVGVEVIRELGSHVRVWAPACRRVEVVERERGSDRTPNAAALEPEGDGYFSGAVTFLGPGTLYGFRLDGSATLYPDPASRFQPDGPHGPSQVVDPSLFTWSDQAFRGVPREGQVIYELHVGTFTREGTFLAALAELPELQRLGITLIELMPIADFPGRFGWGYDGVDLWAPTRLYGTPDELRRFVDEAHRLGLGVILDVVYNHLGPDGNYLKVFSPHYFTDRYDNEWGEALNFDGEHSTAVRQFFVENAAYWIDEFHFDGLRLDATQSIHDASPTHLIAELTERMRAAARAQDKTLYIVAENEPQHAEVARPVKNAGYGCDALWNDDFHHTARVALTGKREAYYMDYCGSPQELISAIKWGYLYQGQHYFWQDQRRGKSALDLSATQYVTYLQNHDQIANSLCGDRIHKLSSAAELRAMTALMLLAPATPMLFQGQEFASSTPFLYFADHKPDLARLVTKGRREFLQQFPSIAMPDANPKVPDASEYSTFERCKLDFSERERNRSVYDLHADLLRLRREDPAFRQQLRERVHGAVLSSHAFVLRYECDAGDRLLLVNLGFDLELRPAPEPLLATPDDEPWQVVWCSEHPKYGGSGFGEPYNDGMWSIPARSATVFVAG